MRPSLQKRVKIDDSSQKLKENVYLSMYPSPCQSYDPNKWLQSNDVSWLSASLDQDIDKMLKIALPQPLKLQNRKSSSNQIIEEIDPHLLKNKKKPWQFDNKENIKNLENSKLKINMSEIICEFPIQKVSRSSQQEQPKTPVNQKSFMEAIISKYQNSHKEAEFEQERNFIFQDQEKIAELYPQSQRNETHQNEINDNQDDNQIYNESEQSNAKNKIKEEVQIKKRQYQRKNSKRKQTQKQCCSKKTKERKKRVSKNEIKKDISDVVLEKTKQITKPQNLETHIFPTNQLWGKVKIRREAKKYEQYQMQEFKDLLQSLSCFYVHKSEGDLKVDKMRPMQNLKERYFQQFELWINPYVLIGPVKMQKQVKLHVRFKKGYSGQIFCDKALQETLPINQVDQVDGKTFSNQDLILANNTDHVVKLVCCLVNIKLKSKKKQYK